MDSLFEELRAALQDRYRVDALVGRGGMATVYSALDLKHDRRVAIKLLSPDLAATIGGERFAREIRIAARLTHPNILSVFDSGQAGSLLYYVMPFVEGEALRDRLDRETHLPIDDAIGIACEVADALAYAHAAGVVHRDIKPENILLQSGHALVADFGIAKAIERSSNERLTGTGMSLGTAAYMSPEQSAGGTVDVRSDIYALGCTVYELLAGQPPFTGPNAMAVMARHALDQPPSIRVVRAAVPEELEAAVLHALEKVPADRFQTMEEFKRAILGEMPAGVTANTARYTARYRTAAAPPPRLSRKRWAIGASAVALVLIAGSVAVARGVSRKPLSSTADAKRVAVLYFDDQSDGRLRYVADGLTESLIKRLSDIAALHVISAGGVKPYRGQRVQPDSIGRALHVGSVVRGSVDSSGGKIRVTVRLVDALADDEIDHKSIEFAGADIATQQDTVAAQVVDFLRQRLGDQVRLRQSRSETTNSVAWTLVERAKELRRSADSLASSGSAAAAVRLLGPADSLLAEAERADAKWPRVPATRAQLDYARALVLARTPGTPVQPAIDSGLASADRALRIDPNNADALEARGELQYLRYTTHLITDRAEKDRTLAEAEASLRKSVEVNPNQATAYVALSQLDYAKPDVQLANIDAAHAYQADAYLASASFVLRRLFWTSHDLEDFPAALKWCTTWHARFPLEPASTECRMWMYTTRLQQPDVDSAWTLYHKYISLAPPNQRDFAQRKGQIIVAGVLAHASLGDSARHMLNRAHANAQLDPKRELEGYEAAIWVMLGTRADKDSAVHLIKDYLTVNPDHGPGFTARTGVWWRGIQDYGPFRSLIASAR